MTNPFSSDIKKVNDILKGNFSKQSDRNYWENKLEDLKAKSNSWSEHEHMMKVKSKYNVHNNDFDPYRD